MRIGIRAALIVSVSMFMIASFTFAGEREEKNPAENTEEDTMLNIMSLLNIPKKTVVRYSIREQFEYLDNYYLSSKGKQGRFGLITTPEVSVKYPMNKVRSYVEGNYQYSLADYLGENVFNRHNVEVKAYHRPTRRLSIGVLEKFVRSDAQDEQTGLDVKVAGEALNRNNLSMQGKYELTKKIRCGVTGNYGFVSFKETVKDTTPDRTEFGAGGDMEYVVDRQSIIRAAYNFYRWSFKESGNEKDSDQHSMSLNYLHKITKTSSVTAHAGYDLISYESRQETGSASAGFALDYAVSRFTKFNLKYNYALQQSLREQYLAYEDHSFQGGVTHYFNPRLTVGMNASYDLYLYNPEDSVSSSGITSKKVSHMVTSACYVNYKFSKNIDLGMEYYTNMKFSDFSDDQYFSNHYILNLKAKF